MRQREWRKAADALSQHLKDETWTPKILERLVTCLTNAGMLGEVERLATTLRERDHPPPPAGHRTHGFSFLNRQPDNPHKDYVFVAGAPRSGTSTFGRLLSWHPEIAMFTERYRPYLGYHPNMFRRRPLYFENNAHVHAAQHSAQAGKLDACAWIGDKRPNFAYGLPFTTPNFVHHNLVVLHLARNPHEICWSYEHVSDKDHHFSGGYRLACDEINANNRALLRYAPHFHVIDYGKLYAGVENLLSIFELLKVQVTDDLKARFTEYYDKHQDVLGRERLLDKETAAYIEQAIDWDAHSQLLGRAL